MYTPVPNFVMKKIWRLCIVGFRILVAVLVVAASILPADSMSIDAACHQEEHQHGDSCYAEHTGTWESALICTDLLSGQMVAHCHDSFCYDDAGQLICPLEEVSHVHEAACQADNGDFICGVTVHQHTEDCFVLLDENTSASVLECGKAVHQHGTTCASTVSVSTDAEATEMADSTASMVIVGDSDTASEEETLAVAAEETDAPQAISYDNALPLNTQQEDGTYPYLDAITISYRNENGQWIEIGAENADLPANTDFRLKVSYKDVPVDMLLHSDNQMKLEGIPTWIQPAQSGTILDENGNVAADLQVLNGTALVTFAPSYLAQYQGSTLSGSFYVRGTMEWDRLEGDNTGTLTLPNLNLTLHFEEDLAEKYGDISIEKAEPTLVEDADGTAYLQYQVTISSQEEKSIPQVVVTDSFTKNEQFVVRYVGVTSDKTTLASTPSAYDPYETSTQTGATSGTVEKTSSGMLWTIGDLAGMESRTLTYYVALKDSYVGAFARGTIQNTAAVSSGDTAKGEDTASFTPSADAEVQKKRVHTAIDEAGNGTITYEITVSAPSKNSYTLVNLRLQDAFGEALKGHITGDTLAVTSTLGTNKTVSLAMDAGFTYTIPTLHAGEIQTLTYTVQVENVYAAFNGTVDLTNTAALYSETNSDRGYASNRLFSQVENSYWIEQQQWVRKIYGGPTASGNVTIPSDDPVYTATGTGWTKMENPETFSLPQNSQKYQVVVNEGGTWNVSSATMTDSFGDSTHMQYTGYLQVQAFSLPEGAVASDAEDSTVISLMQTSTPVQTVWVNIDGESAFSFAPKDLGFAEDANTYLLTYYTVTKDMENVGDLYIANDFGISGDVGIGDVVHRLSGVHVTVQRVFEGGASSRAQKFLWYATADPSENGTVKLWKDPSSNYEKGAVYWIIKLEGNIKANFGVRDICSGDSTFYFDSVVAAYKGSRNADLTAYASYGQLAGDAAGTLKKLSGPPYNQYSNWDQTNTRPQDPDYSWEYSGGSSPITITFLKDMELSDDEAIYLIVRGGLTQAEAQKEDNLYIQNTVTICADTTAANPYWKDGDTAEYVQTYATVMKDPLAAFTYDADTKEFASCYVEEDGTDFRDGSAVWSRVPTGALRTSGTYVVWNLNINWDGTLSGAASVQDILPEGLEFVYTDVYWVGRNVQGDPPQCVEIPELEASPEWTKLETDYNYTGNRTAHCIAYYNAGTGEIRWDVEHLQENPTPSGNDAYQIALRLVCKVTDPDVLLSATGKTISNTVTVTAEDGAIYRDTASMTLQRKGSFTKQLVTSAGTTVQGGIPNYTTSKLRFQIEVNHLEESLTGGDTLPPLIDELSNSLAFLENSLVIQTADGQPVTGYKYTIQQKEDHQMLTITNLPDRTDLLITYDTTIAAAQHTTVSITNKAYWKGYEMPDSGAQVNIEKVQYDLSGDVTADYTPVITITKVDADNFNAKLRGAAFSLYQYDIDGESRLLCSGTTDAGGTLTFQKTDAGASLAYDQVYYLEETAAPSGYTRNTERHYFVLLKGTSADDYTNFTVEGTRVDLELWYGGYAYTCTWKNSKGTIGVTKQLLDKNGNVISPIVSRSFRFGLYDQVPDATTKPLQTLTVTYDAQGNATYDLDGVSKTTAAFTQAESGGWYSIYELDDDGAPIASVGNIDGQTYAVTYATTLATVSQNVTITNQEVFYTLPVTGGIGLRRYYAYAVAAWLMLSGLLLYGHRKWRLRRKQ
jgi:hypothetical protein